MNGKAPVRKAPGLFYLPDSAKLLTMLSKVEFTNVGPLTEVFWSDLGTINLIIGSNSSGKTFFLKALYSAMRMMEEYKRGNDPRSASYNRPHLDIVRAFQTRDRARDFQYPVVAAPAQTELGDGGLEQVFGRSVHLAVFAQLLGIRARVATHACPTHPRRLLRPCATHALSPSFRPSVCPSALPKTSAALRCECLCNRAKAR